MLALNRRTFLGATLLGTAELLQGRKSLFGEQSGQFRELQPAAKWRATLKKVSSGGIYIHPWDITDEGIDNCFDYLGDTCGLNELFLAAIYHASTFVLPHNPKRMVRWDEGRT